MMFELIAQFFGFILYVAPAILCLGVYSVRTGVQVIERDPELTWGDIAGRVAVSITPLANIWAICLDIIPNDVMDKILNKAIHHRPE